MDGMDDLVKEFLVESYENLDQLDRDFVALETDPTATDKLGSIFRTIHTIKGTCGCLGFPKLESVAHVGENLLSRLRDGQLVMDTEITSGLLQCVDAIREILQTIERSNVEGDADYSAVKSKLVKLNERPSIGTVAAAPATVAPSSIVTIEEKVALHAPIETKAAAPETPEPATVEVAAKPTEVAKETKDQHADSVAGNAIRVDVGLLDKLMNLVGELVLARNQVLQYNASQQDAAFVGTAQRLNLITSELQEGVMKTRMQPIGNLWNKFPRIVRDVSTACGKKVRVEMDGKDTELDKTILEAIKDPLTHVIRNSVDHGIETPAKRLAAGKTEEGQLFMRAFHEGGQVNIEITDDGAGIDPERVKKKAIEKGLITAEQAARMSEREAINLIFAPGFSTAEKVTNVSGRGVGMDVVKTNVEKIGGTVDVKSKVGSGTTLRIKIPLTLAIIPALVVTSGGERFAIPQVSLLELVRLDQDATGKISGIEMINGTPLYRLRGNLLPLVYLDCEFRLATADAAKASAAANIVVLRGGERQFGLVVDQINDTEEIVVKPLSKLLKGQTCFAGATIMGDGKVALILDVMGVAQQANIVAPTTDAAVRTETEHAKANAADKQMLLLFKLRDDTRMGIPLASVARLEEFAIEDVEHAGEQQVVQYRDQIMPLIDIATELGVALPKVKKNAMKASKIYVIVANRGDRSVGLHVDRILDVADEVIRLQPAGARKGVLGTAVIKDEVTELLDVESLLPNEDRVAG
jgi:two-component system chemotaxis sensor kinase CheA